MSSHWIIYIQHGMDSMAITFEGIIECLVLGYQPLPWLALLIPTNFHNFSKGFVPCISRYIEAQQFWGFSFSIFLIQCSCNNIINNFLNYSKRYEMFYDVLLVFYNNISTTKSTCLLCSWVFFFTNDVDMVFK